MPASLYTSAAHMRPACGLMRSRPAPIVGSDFTDVPWIHATGRSDFAAAAAEPMTMAAAPSEEGHVSA